MSVIWQGPIYVRQGFRQLSSDRQTDKRGQIMSTPLREWSTTPKHFAAYVPKSRKKNSDTQFFITQFYY